MKVIDPYEYQSKNEIPSDRIKQKHSRSEDKTIPTQASQRPVSALAYLKTRSSQHSKDKHI